MKRKNLPYGWDLPVMKSKLVCKILFSVKREFPNKKEEQTHNDTISFKRSCRLCGEDRMHKNYLGKLASQSDFCAYCLHCYAMETF